MAALGGVHRWATRGKFRPTASQSIHSAELINLRVQIRRYARSSLLLCAIAEFVRFYVGRWHTLSLNHPVGVESPHCLNILNSFFIPLTVVRKTEADMRAGSVRVSAVGTSSHVATVCETAARLVVAVPNAIIRKLASSRLKVCVIQDIRQSLRAWHR